MAWDAGYHKIVLETDAMEVFELLTNGCNPEHEDYDTCTLIQSLLKQEWEVRLKHIHKCCNASTDHLAKVGLNILPE